MTGKGGYAIKMGGDKIVLSTAQRQTLRQQLDEARQALIAADAQLAEAQAAVNSFRLQCRLLLDDLVDELQKLSEEKQSLLIRIRLRSDEAEHLHNGDQYWREEISEQDEDDGLPLPTDTPRDKAAEKRLFRELARRFHPDLATTSVERAYRTSIMMAVNAAYAERDVQALYDLAGELDPGQIAELDAIASSGVRQVRRQILTLQRRERKARQRLRALRREKTARLWQKAVELDREGVDWWEPVREELCAAIARRREEIAALRKIDELLPPLTEADDNPVDS